MAVPSTLTIPAPPAAAGRHEIPTHLGVDDRALLGLTMRQVMFLMLGCAAAYWLWSEWPGFPGSARAAAATAALLAAAFVAFLRPHGRALEEWAFVAARYAALPKGAAWRRASECPGRRVEYSRSAERWQ
jgi:hypothetical protein